MPPLDRSISIPSIHSWWSDSNRPAGTISLHAAAKPLMRYLYLRQVRDFIRNDWAADLSRESMEIFMSYLAYQYISPAAQVLVLRELNRRASIPNDAKIVAEALAQHETVVIDLLRSKTIAVRQVVCELLAKRITQSSLFFPAVASRTYLAPIVMCIRDEDLDLSRSAIFALSGITLSLEGAQVAVDMNLQEDVARLLYSNDRGIQMYSCALLGNILAVNANFSIPWHRILYFLDFKNTALPRAALTTLFTLVQKSPAEATSLVSMGIVPATMGLLHSGPGPRTRELAHSVLRELANNPAVSVAVCRDFLHFLAKPDDKWTHRRWHFFTESDMAMVGDFFDEQVLIEATNQEHNIFMQLLLSEDRLLRGWAINLESRIRMSIE